MFLLIISFLSNNPWIFTIAIFIFATTITNQEFLEILAAIMSKSKEYFDYKKGVADPKEKDKKIAKEIDPSLSNTNNLNKITEAIQIKRTEINAYAKLQKLALDRLSKDLGIIIDRDVKFSNEFDSLVFDGFFTKDGKDFFVEVKKTDNAYTVDSYKLDHDRRLYKSITNRDIESYLIIISNVLSARDLEVRKYLFDKTQVFLYTYEEIGFKSEIKKERK